jgi:Mce-associated membrane protein
LSRYTTADKEPDAAEPDVTGPDAAESDAAESDAAESNAAESNAAESNAAESNAAESNAAESNAAESNAAGKPGDKSARRRVTVSVRSLVIAVVIIAVVGSVAVLGWLYMGAQHKLDAQARQSADNAHAEKIALDYAVNAAAMDFQDINAWKVKLVAGTTPELNDKLTKAATSIEQILVPLQWTSTAKPLVAKVHSHTGSTYVVDAFVSVMTKTIQAPEPLQSTATYSVTLDSSKDWKISDVGGIGAAVEEK